MMAALFNAEPLVAEALALVKQRRAKMAAEGAAPRRDTTTRQGVL